MAAKKHIRAKQYHQAGFDAEKAGDFRAALSHYKKATSTHPASPESWNRMMILYRKTKTIDEEIVLIKTAITGFKKGIEEQQKERLKTNKSKADSSIALARMLGLLQTNGLPGYDNTIIERWEQRVDLLKRRRDRQQEKTKQAKAKPLGKKVVKSKTTTGKTKTNPK